MYDTFLCGPRAVTFEFKALADGYGDVLMPGDLPVGRVSLVEERGANDEGFGAEDGFDDGADGWILGDLLESRDAVHDVADAPALFGGDGMLLDEGDEMGGFVGREDVWRYGEAVGVEFLQVEHADLGGIPMSRAYSPRAL